jgi:hypothetical protein
MCANRIFSAKAVTHSLHIKSAVADRTKAAASSASREPEADWRRRKARSRCSSVRHGDLRWRPWQIVSGPCNQRGDRSALEAPKRISLRKFFKRIASGAPPVDPDQTGSHSEMDEPCTGPSLNLFPAYSLLAHGGFLSASPGPLEPGTNSLNG